ncbi:MAG: Hsp20 family protein [Arsenophonus sp.]|nr:MAG: Hsp20 family protein [Arsenophonus sp.]
MAYRSSFSLFPMLNDNILSDRFAQMDRLFSRITGEKPLSDTPSYNLLQKDKNKFFLTISVPGYTRKELDISVLNTKLTISGKKLIKKNLESEKKDQIRWLHKGIKKRDFSMSFDLDHRIKINSANLSDGLLTLSFNYEIPEADKPKKISIGLESNQDIIEHKID